MLYFGFGSNLDPDLMRERCPGNRVAGVAVLRDHKLIFPRYSKRWNGGVASLQLSHGNDVWGVLYDLSDEEMRALDQCEGFTHAVGDANNRYERDSIWVDFVRPADGSVPRRVRAWTYRAREANPSPPSRRYMDTVIKGARAHHLPDDYVAMLTRLPVLAEEPGPQS
jgi:hypothetical protein